jgi:hypothetical protein
VVRARLDGDYARSCIPTSENAVKAKGRRITILFSWVNRGKVKGRGCSNPGLLRVRLAATR